MGMHSTEKGEAGWSMYCRLIEGIPPGIEIEECLVGLHWTLVRSVGVGIAMTPPEGVRHMEQAGTLRGRKVRDLAKLMKSWNLIEAAIGVAAVNSYYNSPGVYSETWGIDLHDQSGLNAFEYYRDRIEGKKVAVIGHFPGLEGLSKCCDLSILERRPHSGDFPDPACEYLIPQQDAVFMIGTTLINKTMPRLLMLSTGRMSVVVGPTTPLTPVLFKYGATALAGSVVIDEKSVWRHVAEGADRSIFSNGTRMVKAEPAMVRVPES